MKEFEELFAQYSPKITSMINQEMTNYNVDRFYFDDYKSEVYISLRDAWEKRNYHQWEDGTERFGSYFKYDIQKAISKFTYSTVFGVSLNSTESTFASSIVKAWCQYKNETCSDVLNDQAIQKVVEKTGENNKSFNRYSLKRRKEMTYKVLSANCISYDDAVATKYNTSEEGYSEYDQINLAASLYPALKEVLSDTEYYVFVNVAEDEYDFEELADSLHMSKENVKSIFNRSKMKCLNSKKFSMS